MKLHLGLAIVLLVLPVAGRSQTEKATSTSMENEPHHSLAFENDRVRVFHLHLEPKAITENHRHPSFYAYFSLQPATISNEVIGHAPVVTQLDAGVVRTSKGGFNVAERNTSAEPADIFIVQPTKSTGDGFPMPLSIPMHEVGIVEQYTGPAMRVYSLAMATGGKLEEHAEAHDLLMIALSDLTIHESKPGNTSEDWKMKAGETRWITRGTTHSEMNAGSAPAALMVFEFD
jgi:quercetin dioxygenase-like cupin family protein